MAFGTQIRSVDLGHTVRGLHFTGSHMLVVNGTDESLDLYSWPALTRTRSTPIPMDTDNTAPFNILAFTGAHIAIGFDVFADEADDHIGVYAWPSMKRIKKALTHPGAGLNTLVFGGFYTGAHVAAGDELNNWVYVLTWPGLQLTKTLTPDLQISSVTDMALAGAGNVVLCDTGPNNLWLCTWPGLTIDSIKTDSGLSPGTVHPMGVEVIGNQVLLAGGDSNHIYQLALN